MTPVTSVLNDALRIVTGCLCSTPTDHLPVPSGIQPTELRCLGATLSLAKRDTLDPDHILHAQLPGSRDVPHSRRSSMSAVRKPLNDLFKLGIRTAQWTNYRWSAEYSKRTPVLHVLIPRASFSPLRMGLPRNLGLFLLVHVQSEVSLSRQIESVAPPIEPQTALSQRAQCIGHLEEWLV